MAFLVVTWGKMWKAGVALAALAGLVCMGCEPTQGGGRDSIDLGNTGAAGGASGGSSGGNVGINAAGAGYFPDKLMMGNAGGSGAGTGGREEKFCKQQNFELNRLPPEILLVLDRSGSMRRNAQGDLIAPDKWSQTTAAIDTTLSNTEKGVYWELKMFPAYKQSGDSPCATAPIASVEPGLAHQASIMSTVRANTPIVDKGATPTAKAMQEATAIMKARTSKNPKFLLLATDGIPNCRDNSDANGDVAGAVAAVAAANAAGFPTFVVGIAPAGVKVDGVDAFTVLNSMAEAGGRERDGDTKFYSANNRTELTDALGSIAQKAADCVFVISEPPASPNDVAAELDGTRLDASDWSYGEGNLSVVVKGAYCDKLKRGDIQEAQVKFGCPGQLIL